MAEKALHQAKQKSRRSLKLCVFALILLSSLAIVINGPLARWAVHRTLHRTLESQDMRGNHVVEGTLWKGFTILKANYKGTGGIQRLNIDRASVNYHLFELFDSKIRTVSVDNVTVVLDSAKFKPSADAKPLDWRSLLTQIRPWVLHPNIQISQLDLTLDHNATPAARFLLGSLKHHSGESTFRLENFIIANLAKQATSPQDVTLDWRPAGASLDRLELLPGIAISETKANWENDLTGKSLLHLTGSTLALSAGNTLRLSLISGSLDSEKLAQTLNQNLPFALLIDALEAEVSDWRGKEPTAWTTSLTASIPHVSYTSYTASDLKLKLTQQSLHQALTLTGTALGSPVELTATGRWTTPPEKGHVPDNAIAIQLKASDLHHQQSFLPELPESLDISKAQLNLTASTTLSGNMPSDITASILLSELNASDTPLPSFRIDGSWNSNQTLSTTIQDARAASPAFKITADYDHRTRDYAATFAITEGSPLWLSALAQSFSIPISLEKSLALKWKGKGTLGYTPSHSGQLNISSLTASIKGDAPISASALASYDWPKSVKLDEIKLLQGDWAAHASLHWDGKTIHLPSAILTREDATLASITGQLPYSLDIRDAKGFFSQSASWKLALNADALSITKIRKWFPHEKIKGLSGTISSAINLDGSPANPKIDGNFLLDELRGISDDQLGPLRLTTHFNSVGNHLLLNGKLTENSQEVANLNLKLPFTPHQWLNGPDKVLDMLENQPISGNADINDLPLSRLKKFIPGLDKVDGKLTATATLGGTVSKPEYTAEVHARIPHLKLTNQEIGDIREVELDGMLDKNRKLKATLKAKINGGSFLTTASAKLTDITNPKFDISLKADHAMIYRDDLILARANGDLRLRGTLKQATLSGSIGTVESLIYKDIELIPIGVPSSAVAAVELPTLQTPGKDTELPIPEPFASWKLDVTLRTQDPILIRGNIARGQITGNMKLRGTAAKPILDGSLIAHDITAKLPFSTLTISKGSATFSADTGLQPKLHFRGTSRVGSHDVSLFIYGSTAAPKTTFTSFPPLPESEIMTLLATGTTSDGLENKDTATFKAFQIFLLKLKQRADQPDGNKLFQKLLSGVEDLDLKVGENDDFTGRKFSSGSIKLHPRWHLTAQLDDMQQTRGLIIYTIRFR